MYSVVVRCGREGKKKKPREIYRDSKRLGRDGLSWTLPCYVDQQTLTASLLGGSLNNRKGMTYMTTEQLKMTQRVANRNTCMYYEEDTAEREGRSKKRCGWVGDMHTACSVKLPATRSPTASLAVSLAKHQITNQSCPRNHTLYPHGPKSPMDRRTLGARRSRLGDSHAPLKVHHAALFCLFCNSGY